MICVGRSIAQAVFQQLTNGMNVFLCLLYHLALFVVSAD